MKMSEKIKILLLKKKTNINQLSKLLNTTSANLYSKLKRDNFSQSELEEIAEALGVKYDSSFVIPETNERI